MITKPQTWTELRDWYVNNFPNDELGLMISGANTFYDLFLALDCYQDVYKLIGVGDSIIRERLFHGLADCIGTDYEYVYSQWLKGALIESK